MAMIGDRAMTAAERQRRCRALKRQREGSGDYPLIGPAPLLEGPQGFDVNAWEEITVATPGGGTRAVWGPRLRPYTAFFRSQLETPEIHAIIADLKAELAKRGEGLSEPKAAATDHGGQECPACLQGSGVRLGPPVTTVKCASCGHDLEISRSA